MGIPGPVEGAIVVVCTALVALVYPRSALMNLNELPDDPAKRLEAYQQAGGSQRNENGPQAHGTYKEGSPLTNDEWTVLAFTPAPDGFASGCGYYPTKSRGGNYVPKYVLTLLCLTFALSLALTDPAYACRDYDGHRNSVVPPECGTTSGGSVSDAIYATWPASLAPAAEAVATCESGLIPDAYNAASGAFGAFQFLPRPKPARTAPITVLSMIPTMRQPRPTNSISILVGVRGCAVVTNALVTHKRRARQTLVARMLQEQTFAEHPRPEPVSSLGLATVNFRVQDKCEVHRFE